MRESAPADITAVSAAQTLGCIRSDRWHMVAAILLDDGFDGEAIVGLSALSSAATGWEVDALIPGALREMNAPTLTVDEAGDVVAGVLAHALPPGNSPVIRFLAQLAPGLDYPGGAIGRAYGLAEWLDCSCHEGSPERSEAARFEEALVCAPSAVRMDLATALFRR